MSKRAAVMAELSSSSSSTTRSLRVCPAATRAERQYSNAECMLEDEIAAPTSWLCPRARVAACNVDVLALVRAHIVPPTMLEIRNGWDSGVWREFDPTSARRWGISWHGGAPLNYAATCTLSTRDLFTVVEDPTTPREPTRWSWRVMNRRTNAITHEHPYTATKSRMPSVLAMPRGDALVLDKHTTVCIAVCSGGFPFEHELPRFPPRCTSIGTWTTADAAPIVCATPYSIESSGVARTRAAAPHRLDVGAARWTATARWTPVGSYVCNISTFGDRRDAVVFTTVRWQGDAEMHTYDAREDAWRTLATPDRACDYERHHLVSFDTDEVLRYHAELCHVYSVRADRWTRRVEWDREASPRLSAVIAG